MSPSKFLRTNRIFVRTSVKYHSEYCSIAEVEDVRSEIVSLLASHAILYIVATNVPVPKKFSARQSYPKTPETAKETQFSCNIAR